MRFVTTCCAWLGVLLIAGCEANSRETGEIIYQSVSAVQVAEQAEFELTRNFTGIVLPARTANIAFEFGGTVQSMLVDEGDRIEEGDLLAQLDTALLAIERRQLQAQLEEAEANLRLASANLARHMSLETDGFASQQRRDELEAGRDAVAARISQLQATLDGNQVRQEKAHLYAPFAGVVGERFLEEGSSAGTGAPVLRILETGQMEAHVGVPRQLAQNLSVDQIVTVQLGERVDQGQVLAVGAELKAQSHTAKVRIQLPPQDVLAGSLVQLRLADSVSGPGFSVPQSALTASMRGLWRVYVLVSAGENLYRVEARDLQLLYSDEQHAFVEGGLNSGETVVTDGVHKLVPGQLVRIVDQGGPV
jgi:RND family efflux transporter MFP subunit